MRNKLNYGVLSKCPLSRVRMSSPQYFSHTARSCAQRAAAAKRPAKARPASEAPVLLAAPVGAAVAALAAELRPVESEEAALRATVPVLVGAELEPVLDALRREEARCCAEERPAVEPPLAQLSEGWQKTSAVSAGWLRAVARSQCAGTHASWRVVMLFFSKSLMPWSVLRQSLQAFSCDVAAVLGQMHCLGRYSTKLRSVRGHARGSDRPTRSPDAAALGATHRDDTGVGEVAAFCE